MEFGSEEWFEKLNTMVAFPKKFSFFYNKKNNTIHACIVNSKAKADNVRWTDLNPAMYLSVPSNSALITVKEIQSAEAYHKKVVELLNDWDAVVQ